MKVNERELTRSTKNDEILLYASHLHSCVDLQKKKSIRRDRRKEERNAHKWFQNTRFTSQTVKFCQYYSLHKKCIIPNPSLNYWEQGILSAPFPWSSILPIEHWLLRVVDRWCMCGLSAGSNPRLIRGPYPEAEEWLVVLLLLPPEEELLTEMMEWGRLLLRKSSPDDTVIELRNRGAAATKHII